MVPLNAKKSVVELGSLEDVLENENIGLEFGHMKTETESVQENMAIVVTMKGWKPNHIKVNQSLSRKSKGMTYKALAGLSATTFKEKLQSSSSKAVLFLDDAVSITGATSDTFDSIIQGEFRTAKEGDLCPDCHSHPTLVISPLSSHEAIEIGHTFYLGTKYSVPLDATFKDQSGKSVPIQMGCFGLGVSRMIAAIVETRNDKDGMIWPICIAPAQVCVVSGPGMDVKTVAEGLSLQISTVLGESSKAAVALDDRDHQIGFKLKDGLLVGYPYLIIVGKAYQESKQVEILQRGTGARIHVGLSEVQGFLYQLKSDKRHLDSMDTLFEFFSK